MTVDARALSEPWQVEFTVDGHVGVSDTSKLGLGGSAGLRPHELLEAALASCMTITARMELHERGLPDDGVAVQVELVREARASRFCFALTLPPELEEQRAVIRERLERSPVRTTLSKALTFVERPSAQVASSATVRRP